MRGKVCRSIPKRIKEWDHPRICGEKESKLQEIEDISGSPPHMRGKVATGRQTVCRCGITPAYAGKRGLRKRGSRNPADHPRICGEKWDKLPSETKQKGSPPHMRGKDVKLTMNAGQLRITPAYAGKSSPWLSGFCRLLGSPPHMRGKVQSVCDDLARVGITPAYAGKR